MKNGNQIAPCQGNSYNNGGWNQPTISMPGLSLGSIVVGGLFFYALYRICSDAVKSVAMNYNKEVRRMDKNLQKLAPAKIEQLRKTAVKLNSMSKNALPKEVLAKISGGDIDDQSSCPVCGGDLCVAQDPETGRYAFYCFDCGFGGEG